MDDDVLAADPAAGADFGQSGRDEQRETLAHHARRGKEFADRAPVRGAIARLFFQFARRRYLRRLAARLVADETRGQFEAVDLQRHAILFDQDDVPPVGRIVDRQDDRGVDAARAGDIFPSTLLLDGDEATGPRGFDGRVGGRAGHADPLCGGARGAPLRQARANCKTAAGRVARQAACSARSALRSSLPIIVLGRSSRTSTALTRSCLPSCGLSHAASASPDTSNPSSSVTKALGVSPR